MNNLCIVQSYDGIKTHFVDEVVNHSMMYGLVPMVGSDEGRVGVLFYKQSFPHAEGLPRNWSFN